MPKTPCHLYRALNVEDFPNTYAGTDTAIPDGFLYPRWQPKNHTARFKRNGHWVEEQRVSPADLRSHKDGKVKKGGGTSLFDCDGWFGFAKWHYFHMPEGTAIPANLHLDGPGEEQSNGSKTRTGHHDQIEV